MGASVNWAAPAYFTLMILAGYFLSTRLRDRRTWKPWRPWFWASVALGLVSMPLVHDTEVVYPLVTRFNAWRLGVAKNKGDLLRQFRQRFGDEETADRGIFQGTIPQALFIMNGSLPNGEIGRANNKLDKILKQFPAPEERLERIFLTVLCRPPSPKELAAYLPHVKVTQPKKEKDPYEDVFWVLLNSSEFMFNH